MNARPEFPKINFRRNDAGELYIAPRRKQYEVDFKRDYARECRLRARHYQELADEYTRRADSSDATADTWQKEVEK